MASNRKIKNAEDLKAEIEKLKTKRDQQELELKESFDLIQETINFDNITSLALQSVLKNVKSDGSIAMKGINLGAHVLIDDILLRNKGPVTKFIAENVVKFVANFFLKPKIKSNTAVIKEQ